MTVPARTRVRDALRTLSASGNDPRPPARMSARRPRVVYWNNVPSPYMVDRFNALARRDPFDFEVWFNDRTTSLHAWEVDEIQWAFRYRYLPSLSLLGRTLHLPLPALQEDIDLLASLYAEPVFVVGAVLASLRGAKVGFRVLKTFETWTPPHPLRDRVKRLLFRRADFFETPGPDGARFAAESGAAHDRIFQLTHTIDAGLADRVFALDAAARLAIRAELGLSGRTVTYVGRLWKPKGLDYLLEACHMLIMAGFEDLALVIVGDGCDRNWYEDKCRRLDLRNVVFAGYRQKPDLERFYAITDVFVFPTLGDPYGLVVDEAMACGLPVVCTTAAGEIRTRIRDGVDGLLVPPGDAEALASGIRLLLGDPALRRCMGKRARETARKRTAELWATQFEHLVERVLGWP